MTNEDLAERNEEIVQTMRHLLNWADGKNRGSRIDGVFLAIMREFRRLTKTKKDPSERRLVINCEPSNRRLVIHCDEHKGPPVREVK